MRVDRLHGRDVGGDVGRVGGGTAVVGLARLAAQDHRATHRGGGAVCVGLPVGAIGAVAVELVADLPVLDAVVVLDVGVAHPVGGDLRARLGRAVPLPDGVAGPVIHGDHGLGPRLADDRHELAEAHRLRVVSDHVGVGLPVVLVRLAATGQPDQADPGAAEQ